MVRAQTAAGLLLIGLSSGCYEVQPVVQGGGCQSKVTELAAELYDLPQGCTAALEYDNNFALQRWQLVCDSEPSATIDELQARRLTECCTDEPPAEGSIPAVNRDDPFDAYVFYYADDMGDGSFAVVSRHTVKRVYEADLSSGEPNVRFPMMGWRDPNELAIDCSAEALTDVASFDEDGEIAPDSQLMILDNVRRTGIPDAMRQDDGELLWTILLRAGAGPGGAGGWVALLQSSSLNIDYS